MILNFSGGEMHELVEPPGFEQADDRDDQPAEHHHDELEEIGPGNRPEPP